MCSTTRLHFGTSTILIICKWRHKCTLDPIMFADDTKFFHIQANIQKLLSTMNEELASINQWFTSNKLCLNANEKNIYSFFLENPIKKMTSLLCYQCWLSVIILLRGKDLLNFSENYYMKTWTGKNILNIQKTK